jgi:[ribosomal protein S5]-alanine N-acetyltransferase
MNLDAEKTIVTEHLVLNQLSISDTDFIFELVNTPGWLTYIGDKKIYSTADAKEYIQKINTNQTIIYWTVKLKETHSSIGLVTFIKRDYLPYHDLGFAFLPSFNSKGYAHEAAQAVLVHLLENRAVEIILAISLPDNISSIKLLQKLGFQFKNEVQHENDVLHLYETQLLHCVR